MLYLYNCDYIYIAPRIIVNCCFCTVILIECFVYVDGANPNTKNSPDSGYPGDGSSGLNGELQPHNGLDNGFYENLPFHGMNKQQPHKQVSPLSPKIYTYKKYFRIELTVFSKV